MADMTAQAFIHKEAKWRVSFEDTKKALDKVTETW